MTEKELRRLNRYQLLELLIIQTEHAQELQRQLEQMEQKLREQEMNMSDMGSVAEASLRLSGVFEAAQCAADRYLEEARKRGDRIVQEAYRRAADIAAASERRREAACPKRKNNKNHKKRK